MGDNRHSIQGKQDTRAVRDSEWPLMRTELNSLLQAVQNLGHRVDMEPLLGATFDDHSEYTPSVKLGVRQQKWNAPAARLRTRFSLGCEVQARSARTCYLDWGNLIFTMYFPEQNYNMLNAFLSESSTVSQRHISLITFHSNYPSNAKAMIHVEANKYFYDSVIVHGLAPSPIDDQLFPVLADFIRWVKANLQP